MKMDRFDNDFGDWLYKSFGSGCKMTHKEKQPKLTGGRQRNMYKEIKYKDWSAERLKGIGGSEAAAACGLSTPWLSPVKLFMLKTEMIKDDQAENERMEWGNRAEAMIRKAFEEKHGIEICKPDTIWQSKKYPHMIANIDGYGTDADGKKFILEIKNVSEYMRNYWAGDEVPEAYEMQVRHYLIVSGFEYGIIAYLIGGNKYNEKVISRDQEIEQIMINKEAEFWQRVQDKDMPAPDGSIPTADSIKNAYPESIDDIILLTPEIEEKIYCYQAMQDQISEFQKQADAIKQDIQLYMKTAKRAEGSHFYINWNSYYKSGLDSKKLKADLPDIYAKYQRQSAIRPFSIKTKKREAK